MAEYCKLCGKYLEDGQVCECTDTHLVPLDIEPEEKKNIFSLLFKTIFKFYNNPITSGAQFVNRGNFKASILLGISEALFMGLLFALMGENYNMLILSNLNYGSLFPFAQMVDITSLKFSFVFVFLFVFLLGLAVFFVFPVFLVGAVKLLRGKTAYKYMLSLGAVKSAALIPGIIVAIILSLFLPQYSNLTFMMADLNAGSSFIIPLIIVGGGLLFGILIMEGAISGGAYLKKDGAPYVVFFATILITVAVYFLFVFLSPVITPEPYSNMINPGNLGDIFNSLF